MSSMHFHVNRQRCQYTDASILRVLAMDDKSRKMTTFVAWSKTNICCSVERDFTYGVFRTEEE